MHAHSWLQHCKGQASSQRCVATTSDNAAVCAKVCATSKLRKAAPCVLTLHLALSEQETAMEAFGDFASSLAPACTSDRGCTASDINPDDEMGTADWLGFQHIIRLG